MKKKLLIVLIFVLICTAAVSADDIWEPELPEINMFTVMDLFSWGDRLEDIEDYLIDYRFFGADVEKSEDDVPGHILTYREEKPYGSFICSFIFDQETEGLWQIRTDTYYDSRYDVKDIREDVSEFYGLDSMEAYEDDQKKELPEDEFNEYAAAADAKTIFRSGYARANDSRAEGRVYFACIDREYYEKRTDL